MTRALRRGRNGFSTIELVVAMAVALTITAAVFAMLDPATGAFRVQPESADIEQRLRAAADAITRDLLVAGAGVWAGPLVGAMGRVAPGVLPYRVGRRTPDPPGSFRGDRFTVVGVVPGAAQSIVSSPMAAASGAADVAPGPGCRSGDPSCGFRVGMMVVVYDAAGSWDLFSVTATNGSLLSLQHNGPDSPWIYPAGSTIAEAMSRTYFVKEDSAASVPQLVQYDGGGGGDVPVVSHVVSLGIEYLGDAEPPAIVGISGPAPGRTTYGPPPPALSEQPTAYPAGENCVFSRAPTGGVVSRLPALAAGPVLVPLTTADLTDGPWCPDWGSPARYDADLLRVRAVIVRVRVQAALTSLRGPAGPLFTRAGTATRSRMVPDREATFIVAPRPMNLVR